MKNDALTIYFVHSGKSNFNDLVYLPVLRSNYLSHHHLIFPRSNKNEKTYFKELMDKADLIVIEMSDPDVNFNVEIKEAAISEKPILALAKKDKGYDPKFDKYVKNVVGYNDENDFRYYVETFAKSYEGKLHGGRKDTSITLGVLN